MSEREEQQRNADTAQKILIARRAIEEGRIRVLPEHAKLAAEIMDAPIGPLGLVDARRISSDAVSFARLVGMAVRTLEPVENLPEQPNDAEEILQPKLFQLFSRLFIALIGAAPDKHLTREQIKERMMASVRGASADKWGRKVNEAIDELRDFYGEHRIALYRKAKKLGGVKFVTGGQRAFTQSALQGIRISGLYADTQLIPDPVYPFLTGDLRLNAVHLQIALDLYYLLQLKPLVDARLPVPPIFVFPSFEQELQRQDPVTMTGINDLIVRVVGASCPGTFTRLEELLEFAHKNEDQFVDAISRARLFVPPGANVDEVISPQDAGRRYLSELEGVRDKATLEEMKRWPLGVLLLNGIAERLNPQYHLFENSDNLEAQPLLTQSTHWYFFEKCAEATATELVRKTVLSAQGFASLRALQDGSLTWLANIPVEGLVDLHRNLEHQAFREELKKFTAQLSAAGPIEIDAAVREVHTGLAFLLSKQQKALRDIEDRYSPKKWGVFVGGALGVATGASVLLMPSLAPILGAAVPATAAIGGVIGIAKEKVGERTEKHRASKTLLGVLATARLKK